MSATVEQILALFKQRQTYYGPLHAQMQAVQTIYNNNAPIPLPDMQRNAAPSVPNLLAQGVDQMAGRIASTVPQASFTSVKPGQRKSDREASNAGRTITGWWQREQLPMKLKRRARHLIAYAMSPVQVRWDAELNQPIRQLRSPMECYPSTDMLDGECIPTDAIFAYRRSYGWLKSQGYHLKMMELFGANAQMADNTAVLLVEYIDGEECVLIAAGYRNDQFAQQQYPTEGMTGVVLERYQHHAGQCPVSIPMRMTLDGPAGQFDTMIGMYLMQARMTALEQIAVEKGIFPDTYLVSRAGEMARFIDGPHDGRTGLINIVTGGDIKELQSQPGYLTNPTIDRIERAARTTAGIPPEFGGESSTNIRTGRRGDAVLSAVIDYPVAEAQESLAYAIEREDVIGIQMAKYHGGSNTYTIYVGTGNNRKPVTYTPNETFKTSEHVVSYPASGTDMNSLVIGLGQRIGLGTMSKTTAQSLDPFIDNPELEHDTIIAESLEQALMAGIQAQAQAGAMSPAVIGKLMDLVGNDKMELSEAITKITEDAAKAAQEAQGGMEQQMAPNALQSMTGSPDQQQVIPGTSAMPGIQQLGDMMGQLRRPAMTIEPMRNVARGAV